MLYWFYSGHRIHIVQNKVKSHQDKCYTIIYEFGNIQIEEDRWPSKLIIMTGKNILEIKNTDNPL